MTPIAGLRAVPCARAAVVHPTELPRLSLVLPSRQQRRLMVVTRARDPAVLMTSLFHGRAIMQAAVPAGGPAFTASCTVRLFLGRFPATQSSCAFFEPRHPLRRCSTLLVAQPCLLNHLAYPQPGRDKEPCSRLPTAASASLQGLQASRHGVGAQGPNRAYTSTPSRGREMAPATSPAPAH